MLIGMLGAVVAPAGASTGGAGMVTTSGESAPKRAAAPVLVPVAGLPQIAAAVTARHAGRRTVSAIALRYVSHAGAPLQVRVDIVRRIDGLSVFSRVRNVAPEVVQRVLWNGRASDGLAVNGAYEIRLSASAGAAASAQEAPLAGGAAPQASAPPAGSVPVGAFTFVGAIFPVRGRHDYGEEGARFGAQRDGHMHEGQDVMARCGMRLVAARGGIAIQRAFHGAAGNYLVIHDPASRLDYVYAHLRDPALIRRGQRVETGQTIGVVGDTGDASTCHLHFEIWTAPGWYAGGQPIDPLPALLSWDRRR